MMTRTLLARCAPLAIAASAALPSIPAIAQDTVTAEPVIVLPSETAPVAQPAPVIVLPEPVPAPSVSAVETAPAEPVSAAPVARQAAPKTSVARTVAAPAPIEPTQSVAAAAQVAPAPLPAQLPTKVAESQRTVAPVPAARDNGTDELAFAGILGALGLAAVGGIAYAATRRRRRRSLDETGDGSVAYQPAFDEPIAEPAIERPVIASAPEPVATAPAYSAPVAAAPALARKAPNSDPVALPSEVPATFEGRDALLKELVAAEPDRANPFASKRARARRAKLIMQSLGRSFQTRKPRIDLSEYTHRWPALRGWHPATA